MKNKSIRIFSVVFILLSILNCNISFASDLASYNENSNVKSINEVDFKKYFGDVEGCAVFYSVKNKTYEAYNRNMINVREIPCSTFKIVSALMGLEYGVINDQHTVLRWDGSKQVLAQWEQDLCLEAAFKASANWYFDRIDEKVGPENISRTIKDIKYGNLETTGEVPNGESKLKISPMEQLELVKKLFNDELPFKKENMKIVRNIMLLDDTNGKLYGKTGTSGNLFLENGNQTAWFVGDYKTDKDEFYFAVRIYGDKYNKNIIGATAQNIAKQICKEIYNK